MTEKIIKFTVHNGGVGLDLRKLAGLEVTDEEAKIIVLQYLADVLEGCAANLGRLADAMNSPRYR